MTKAKHLTKAGQINHRKLTKYMPTFHNEVVYSFFFNSVFIQYTPCCFNSVSKVYNKGATVYAAWGWALKPVKGQIYTYKACNLHTAPSVKIHTPPSYG